MGGGLVGWSSWLATWLTGWLASWLRQFKQFKKQIVPVDPE